MPYIRSVCKAGRTKEICKYYTRRYHPRKEKRQPKKKKTTEKQQGINDRNLERKLTRILNANFDSSSRYVTFTYRKEDRPSMEGLKCHVRELLKKMRKVYREERRELKYVETAEVGERGAMHIHMVINDVDIRKIEKLWKYGFVDSKPLDSSGQYRRLAEYFVKYFQKTRRTAARVQGKAYNCSRNLIRPKPKKKVISSNQFRKEIKVPEGWYLDKDSVREGVTEDGYEYMYYTIVQIHRRI